MLELFNSYMLYALHTKIQNNCTRINILVNYLLNLFTGTFKFFPDY